MRLLLFELALAVFFIIRREKLIGREAQFFKEAAWFLFTRAFAFFFRQAELRGRDQNLNVANNSDNTENTNCNYKLFFCI